MDDIENIKNHTLNVFAMNLKKIRKSRNLTQEKLAEFADVKPETITSLENKKSFPRLDTLCRLCSVLNVKMGDFFKEDINSKMVTISEARDIFSRVIYNVTEQEIQNSYNISHIKSKTSL